MENSTNNTAQNLGVAALVTAIITFVLSVIPCVGLIAIIPGIIAIVLASVGLSHASRNNSPKGILIASLIIAAVATMISFSQVFLATKLAKNAGSISTEIQNIVNDVQDNVIKELEDADVSIKIESNGEKVEINTSSDKKDKQLKLEVLEGKPDSTKDGTVPEKK